MTTQPASIVLEVNDPRADELPIDPPQHTGRVPFEVLLHYAALERKKEDELFENYKNSPDTNKVPYLARLFGRKTNRVSPGTPHHQTVSSDDEKPKDSSSADEKKSPSPSISDDERAHAYRALRTATWLSIFYLITTDILGPTSSPWAFSQLGFVPGVLLFFILGIVAFYTGMQLWYMYMKLDSRHYPVKNYSDLTERIFGTTARHGVNILQTIQLLFNVAVIILGNTQGLSQISKGKVCFSVLGVIWMLAGMLIGQIRSLQNYGGLAHCAIWMNLIVMFMTMGAVAHSPPNFDAAKAQSQISPGPIVTTAKTSLPFSDQIVGVMQMVYAYGGAMLFIELMAEMRRPFDFWKGMISAQLLIVTVYLMYGVFVYAFQGQFTINPANQGISTFGLQTATNVINLLSAIIAAGLYGNIGIKVIYVNIIQDLFKGPVMVSRAGRFIWCGLVIGYWAVAFVIASAIPQFSNISGIVAAICILQFTYTFPPILFVGFTVQRDAIEGQSEFAPGSAVSAALHDTWSDWSRWRRGFGKRWWLNIFNIILFLAALATAGLGAFSSIEGIITSFNTDGAASSFGCKAPV